MDRFKFELTDIGVDLDKRLFESVHAIGCMIQVPLKALSIEACRVLPYRRAIRQGSGDLLAQVSLNRFDLCQQPRSLSVEAEDVDFAVDSFGDSHHGFIDGTSGDGKLFLESAKKFEGHEKAPMCNV